MCGYGYSQHASRKPASLPPSSDGAGFYRYTSCGNVRIFKGYDSAEGREDMTVIGNSLVDNPIFFTSCFYDSEAGLYYTAGIYYCPAALALLQSPPIAPPRQTPRIPDRGWRIDIPRRKPIFNPYYVKNPPRAPAGGIVRLLIRVFKKARWGMLLLLLELQDTPDYGPLHVGTHLLEPEDWGNKCCWQRRKICLPSGNTGWEWKCLSWPVVVPCPSEGVNVESPKQWHYYTATPGDCPPDCSRGLRPS